jgi:putative thioredoxin
MSIIELTQDSFQDAIKPDNTLIVDFWAPWCGPCRSLGPILEKLVQEYAGRFVLAKLNTDKAPQLSAMSRVRSIPLVMLFAGGRPVDQFVGAQPESQIGAFLDRHLTPAEGSPIDQLRAEAAEADPETAEAMLREGLEMEPGHLELTLDLAERLVGRQAFAEARKLLDRVAEAERNDRHRALLRRIELAANKPPGDPAELAARIATNAKDFDARFALAALQVHAGDYRAAFDQLLEVVLRDRGDWREKARLKLIEWFEACPDAEAVDHGRRYLGMYLN